jgi:hypothetical protein
MSRKGIGSFFATGKDPMTVDKSRALDAVQAARNLERERCAQIAERLCDEGRDGYQIAKVIRAGIPSQQHSEGE